MRALSLFHQRWTNQHDWGAASTVKTAVSLEPRVLECYKLHRDLQPRLPKLLKWDNRETHFTINQRLIYFNGRATKWETTLQKKKHILVLPEHLEPISVPVQPHVMRWEEAVDITCPLTGTVRLNSVERTETCGFVCGGDGGGGLGASSPDCLDYGNTMHLFPAVWDKNGRSAGSGVTRIS